MKNPVNLSQIPMVVSVDKRGIYAPLWAAGRWTGFQFSDQVTSYIRNTALMFTKNIL